MTLVQSTFICVLLFMSRFERSGPHSRVVFCVTFLQPMLVNTVCNNVLYRCVYRDMRVFEIGLQFMYEFAFELFKYLLHTWDYVP